MGIYLSVLFFIIWITYCFSDIHKVFNGLYTPFYSGGGK